MHVVWLLLTINTVKLLLTIDTGKQPTQDLHQDIHLSPLSSVRNSSIPLRTAHLAILTANGANNSTFRGGRILVNLG